MERNASQGVLGSLAGYAMSDSDEGETEDMHKLSGNISGSDDEHSSHSQVPSRTYSPIIKEDEPPEKKKAAVSSLGLVSYGGQDEDDSDQDVTKVDSDDEAAKSESSAEPSQEDAATLDDEKAPADDESSQDEVNGSAQSADAESSDVVIPDSPPGSPSQSLIEKIVKISKRGPGSLDNAIQNNKSFRNPSIYEKLLSHVGVDEKGTNYPLELYDPSIWGKSSFYDELAKLQNIEMEKRKAEKKDRVKVDFITATKTGTTTTETSDGAGNKKSKWDSGAQQTSQTQSQTGTTVPPVGSLIKKK